MRLPGSTAAAVRSTRLVGGMVLMAYVTGHLLNIAFGLVSLDVLDRLRGPMLAPWQTIPGQVVLYGALLSHLVLGLLAIAQRRCAAGLSRSDFAQLVLGLGVPVLLATHVMRMRLGVLLGADHVTYGTALVAYWRLFPLYGLLQVLGLVAVWVHGCLGLYGWLKLRRWWPAAAPFLYPPAFALPILALLGFVEAGNQALARFAGGDPAWAAAVRLAVDRYGAVEPAVLGWRDRWLVLYAAAAVAALLLFAVQMLRHRRRSAVVTHVGGRRLAASRGVSLLEIDRQNGMPHASACSGRARCGTCRVRVLDGLSNLSPVGEPEHEVLERLHLSEPGIRLACQAILMGPAVTVERLVPADAEDEAAREPDAAAAPVAAE